MRRFLAAVFPEVFFAGIILLVVVTTFIKSPIVLKDKDVGVLLLAHGAGQKWNDAVRDEFLSIPGSFKKEVVFGMGDAEAMQKGISALEKEGVKGIVVVPLFLSSHSEMYRQVEYVLGQRSEPDVLFGLLMEGTPHGGSNHFDSSQKVSFSLPYVVGKPVGFDVLIAEVLFQYISELDLRDGSRIFFVAHGPISQDDDIKWLNDLNRYAKVVSDFLYSIGYEDVRIESFTLRDDAPPFIRDAATAKIQEAASQARFEGRKVFVIPYLLALGGREEEIRKLFENCDCTILQKSLINHRNISHWIEREIASGKAKLQRFVNN